MLFKTKKDIIGIDVGSSSVKLVQLKEVKGAYHLVNIGMASLPPEAIVDNTIMDSHAVGEAIRNLVESHHIKTKNVATSISGHSVIIRKIQLPIMTEEEMEASIQWEAEQYIPFDIAEVNLDFQILGPDEKDPSQMHVILAAAKNDFVNEYVTVFKEVGLNPLVMDIDCFAMENAFEATYGFEEGEIVALVNLGASAINVNVLRGRESLFNRDIQAGGQAFSDEIQKRFGLNYEDAEKVRLGAEVEDVDPAVVAEIITEVAESLAQEVQRSLDFFSATSADEKVQKLFITGGVSKTAQIRDLIEERMGVPVEVFDPFRHMVANEKDFDPEYLQAVGPFFTVASGLAMRRLGDK